jgi:hypothetical protein
MVTQQNVAHVRPSVLKDAAIVADNLRKEDAAECKAQAGSSPRESLLYCYFMSKPCMTIVSAEGKPIGMYGTVQEGVAGRIWLLGCDAMIEELGNNYLFLRESKRQLAKLQEQFPILFNLVDARNEVHVRWIQWLGFTFIHKHPQWGPEGRLFYEFVKI